MDSAHNHHQESPPSFTNPTKSLIMSTSSRDMSLSGHNHEENDVNTAIVGHSSSAKLSLPMPEVIEMLKNLAACNEKLYKWEQSTRKLRRIRFDDRNKRQLNEIIDFVNQKRSTREKAIYLYQQLGSKCCKHGNYIGAAKAFERAATLLIDITDSNEIDSMTKSNDDRINRQKIQQTIDCLQLAIDNYDQIHKYKHAGTLHYRCSRILRLFPAYSTSEQIEYHHLKALEYFTKPDHEVKQRKRIDGLKISCYSSSSSSTWASISSSTSSTSSSSSSLKSSDMGGNRRNNHHSNHKHSTTTHHKRTITTTNHHHHLIKFHHIDDDEDDDDEDDDLDDDCYDVLNGNVGPSNAAGADYGPFTDNGRETIESDGENLEDDPMHSNIDGEGEEGDQGLSPIFTNESMTPSSTPATPTSSNVSIPSRKHSKHRSSTSPNIRYSNHHQSIFGHESELTRSTRQYLRYHKHHRSLPLSSYHHLDSYQGHQGHHYSKSSASSLINYRCMEDRIESARKLVKKLHKSCPFYEVITNGVNSGRIYCRLCDRFLGAVSSTLKNHVNTQEHRQAFEDVHQQTSPNLVSAAVAPINGTQFANQPQTMVNFQSASSSDDGRTELTGVEMADYQPMYQPNSDSSATISNQSADPTHHQQQQSYAPLQPPATAYNGQSYNQSFNTSQYSTHHHQQQQQYQLDGSIHQQQQSLQQQFQHSNADGNIRLSSSTVFN